MSVTPAPPAAPSTPPPPACPSRTFLSATSSATLSAARSPCGARERLGESRDGLDLVALAGQHALHAAGALELQERERRLVGELSEQVDLLERKAGAQRPVKHVDHPKRLLSVQERRAHQALGHEAGALGGLLREARIRRLCR